MKKQTDAAIKQEEKPASKLENRLAYNLQEVAIMLGLSYMTVWRLTRRGLLRTLPALRHKIATKTELDRFLQS